MRITACVLLLLIPTYSAWAESWSMVSLWKNADQQGDALLQQGQLQAAAKRYHDPFRKAYAEALAGQYAQAARDLGSVHSPDALYNQGNALAHMGDLKGAIKAYDAALSLNPHNRDARHNRELVERALKQTPQTQNEPRDTPKTDEQHPSKSPNSTPSSSSSSSGKSPAAQPDSISKPAQAQQSPEKKSSEHSPATQGNQTRSTSGQTSPGSLSSPPSDLQREQQQWLRSLPDAPGELLQREFMIEHQLRHGSQELP